METIQDVVNQAADAATAGAPPQPPAPAPAPVGAAGGAQDMAMEAPWESRYSNAASEFARSMTALEESRGQAVSNAKRVGAARDALAEAEAHAGGARVNVLSSLRTGIEATNDLVELLGEHRNALAEAVDRIAAAG